MNIAEIIQTIDGGIAIAVLLIVGWRMELAVNKRWDGLMSLIDKLTNGDE